MSIESAKQNVLAKRTVPETLTVETFLKSTFAMAVLLLFMFTTLAFGSNSLGLLCFLLALLLQLAYIKVPSRGKAAPKLMAA